MDRRLGLALALAFLLQAPLVATARYRLSFDAYIHMFFADHYRQSWWVLWEPRWYTGFSVASYPPLVHQVIAALSFLTGVEVAWAAVLLSVLVALPSGVYAFARLFVGRRAAGYAALAAAVLPAFSLTAHAYGQGPTLAGLLGALWGLAVLGLYLRRGRWIDGALAVALLSVVVASHHGTLLFLLWAGPTVGAHTALTAKVGLRSLGRRLIGIGLALTLAALAVIWPFWQWGLGQTMQTPIDHPSRHNFWLDPGAALFSWPMFWPAALAVLGAGWLLPRRRRAALGALALLLFTLGLGGTTPLPGWLYGEGWEWLTYERFALWASVALLPLVGLAAVAVERRLRRRPRAWPAVGGAALTATGLAALVAALAPTFAPTQPAPVDTRPIEQFLAEDNRARWRYLTFGFGDQLARLSLMTEATTLDGSYHTARQLPELRQSGIGQIDAAYWSRPGLAALSPILERAGERGVRWGFVNYPTYAPLLARHGWVYRTTLVNGVEVWENPAAVLPVPDNSAAHSDPLAAASWGLLPLLALGLAIALAGRFGYEEARPRRPLAGSRQPAGQPARG